VFAGTEFGGGSLAGNEGFGGLLFLVAASFACKCSRAAAISALVGCVVSLPLFLYLVFPRPYRLVLPGYWKVLELPQETFIWDGWWITGILAMVFVAYTCGRRLIRSLTVRSSAEAGP